MRLRLTSVSVIGPRWPATRHHRVARPRGVTLRHRQIGLADHHSRIVVFHRHLDAHYIGTIVPAARCRMSQRHSFVQAAGVLPRLHRHRLRRLPHGTLIPLIACPFIDPVRPCLEPAPIEWKIRGVGTSRTSVPNRSQSAATSRRHRRAYAPASRTPPGPARSLLAVPLPRRYTFDPERCAMGATRRLERFATDHTGVQPQPAQQRQPTQRTHLRNRVACQPQPHES